MSGICRLDDAADPRLRVFLGLRDHAERQLREADGGDMSPWFIAEGTQVIDRALDAGHGLQAVLVDAKKADMGWLAELEGDVYLGEPEVLEAVSGRPSLKDPIGCFLRPEPRQAADLLEECRTIVVLEGVMNPTNMGMILRNAAGLGIEAVFADQSCCDPLYRRSIRVSMGQVFAIPHARVAHTAGFLAELSAAGFESVGLTPNPEAEDLRRFERRPESRLAILLGTEGHGLSYPTLAATDHQLRIAMAAGVDSLNVAAASAIAFHALN